MKKEIKRMRTTIKKQKQNNHALYLAGKRKERNNCRPQFNHHMSSCVTPFGRGHGGSFKETMKGQVWSQADITCAT